MLKYVKELVELCLEVNSKTRNEAFFDLSPHIQSVKVCVYLGGYDEYDRVNQEEGTKKADGLFKRFQMYYAGELKGVKPEEVIKYLKGLLV